MGSPQISPHTQDVLDKPQNPHGAEQITKPSAAALSWSGGNAAEIKFGVKKKPKNHPRAVKIEEKGMKVWPEHPDTLSPFLTRSIYFIITKGRTSERGRRNYFLLMCNR